MRGVPGEIPFLIRYIWDPLGITHDRYILSESPGNVVFVHAGTANAPVFPRHGDLQAAGLPAYQPSIILFFRATTPLLPSAGVSLDTPTTLMSCCKFDVGPRSCIVRLL